MSAFNRFGRRVAHAIVVAALLTAPWVSAADFPQRPVKVIVGAAAGSSGDVLGRIVADQLTSTWKQQTVVENRPGAGGVIAIQALLSAPQDGYTLMVSAGSYLVITPFTQKNMPYDVERDITPIAFLAEVPLVFALRASHPAKSLKDFIAFAKANPGKISYGANTPGTFPHMATYYLGTQAGIDITYVPYKGSAAAIQDVMGDRLDMVVEGVSALIGAIKGGTLRPIAVSTVRRLPPLPDVPAAGELVPGYSAVGFFSLIGGAKLPDSIVKSVNEDVRQVLARPDVVTKLGDLGNYPQLLSPSELAATLRREREIWGPVIKRMGFAPQ